MFSFGQGKELGLVGLGSFVFRPKKEMTTKKELA